jgi:class 3 adenylate cyclase
VADWIEVTCCFTDVQGSTRLLRELGPGRYQRVLNEHFGLLRRAFLPNDGIELGTSGDGMFIVFPLPRQALAGCLEAQRLLGSTELGDGTTLRVRMGVHTGPVILDEIDGYVGLTVHQAARIMSAAHGGQILLSAYTASLVPDAPGTWVTIC